MSRKFLWCLFAALVPAVTLMAVTVPPPNLSRALEVQRELVAQSPDDVRALNDLGNLLTLAGDLEGAESAYRRALDIEPDKASARYNLALLLEQQDRRKEAFKQLRLLVEAHPGYAWGWYQIGSMYHLAGQKAKAVNSYARAFRLDPQLAFPEVNPHVIDNPLFTQALIRANQGPSAGSLAPKAYDEPARITGILVPPPPLEETEGVEDGVEDEAEMAAEGMEEPATENGRVLSEGDLDEGGGFNQVEGGTSRGSRYTRSRGTVTRRPPASRGTTPQRFQAPQRGTRPDVGRSARGVVGIPQGRTAPDNESQGGEGNESGAGATQGSRPLTTPQGRVRFRPGSASTGSLGIDLVPAPDRLAER